MTRSNLPGFLMPLAQMLQLMGGTEPKMDFVKKDGNVQFGTMVNQFEPGGLVQGSCPGKNWTNGLVQGGGGNLKVPHLAGLRG